jgi:hypothetical protein
MFKSRLQATYTVFVILGNILIQCNKEKFDLVAWLLLLHLALVATYPHIYEKWMGHTFTKNSAFGRNAGPRDCPIGKPDITHAASSCVSSLSLKVLVEPANTVHIPRDSPKPFKSIGEGSKPSG